MVALDVERKNREIAEERDADVSSRLQALATQSVMQARGR
jgi:hypothetical protein